MRTIILSVAHNPTKQGASDGAYTEYSLSKPITMQVEAFLKMWGVSAHMVDAPNLSETTQRVNAIIGDKDVDDFLALEIHFNAVGSHGSCTLYRKGNEVTKEWALEMSSYMDDCLSRGIHYKKREGAIPFPSEYRDIRLHFLENTKCNSIIVEVDGIDHGQWAHQNIKEIAETIADVLYDISEIEED